MIDCGLISVRLLFSTFLGFFLTWGFLFINSALFSVVERLVDNNCGDLIEFITLKINY